MLILACMGQTSVNSRQTLYRVEITDRWATVFLAQPWTPHHSSSVRLVHFPEMPTGPRGWRPKCRR